MILLKSFNQIVSILLYFINKEKAEGNSDKYISSKEIISALPDFSAESVKKSITKLVNAGILVSTSGPNGGFLPQKNINLENVSLATLFQISEITNSNNITIMRKFENSLFNESSKNNVTESKMNNILKNSFSQFIESLDNYSIKDIL